MSLTRSGFGELEAAGFRGDMFGWASGVLPAVERAHFVYLAEAPAVLFFEERTRHRQLAARPAANALPLPPFFHG